MPARIKHMAIVSDDVPRLAAFYQTLFGMESPGERAGSTALVVSDGYVGMNINPRANGRQGGFDHFGLEVDDVAEIEARLHERYPQVTILKRPSNRPFAGLSTHDPAGQTFDLSQADMENRRDVYAGGLESGQKPRHFDHLMLRTMDPEGIATFYREIFDFIPLEKQADDPNFYLSDGTITLVIAPWRIEDYAGSGIERPALDHIGFSVESLEAFHADLDTMAESNPELAPRAFRPGEGDVRRSLLAACTIGDHQLADPDGVLLDIHEA
ncbi:MAG: hypothetical protein QOF51_465 [Chloroflexota bacterium]|nr:hypothetical protein [Chloroflexota bacterium]